jgi:hypothetical protein
MVYRTDLFNKSLSPIPKKSPLQRKGLFDIGNNYPLSASAPATISRISVVIAV